MKTFIGTQRAKLTEDRAIFLWVTLWVDADEGAEARMNVEFLADALSARNTFLSISSGLSRHSKKPDFPMEIGLFVF